MRSKLPNTQKIKQLYPMYLYLYIEICNLLFIPTYITYSIGWLMILTMVANKTIYRRNELFKFKGFRALTIFSLSSYSLVVYYQVFYVLFCQRVETKRNKYITAIRKNKRYIFLVLLLIIIFTFVIIYT